MRGGSSEFEASEGSKVLFVPSRPVPMGSGGNAFFARLRHVGTFNKPYVTAASILYPKTLLKLTVPAC